MNQQEKETVEHLTSEETDDQGGDRSCHTCGNTNHNETTVSDEKDEGAAQLADLPVADEQADETKGGPGPGSRDSHFRESNFGNELMSP